MEQNVKELQNGQQLNIILNNSKLPGNMEKSPEDLEISSEMNSIFVRNYTIEFNP